MKTNARNQMIGTVTDIKKGGLMCQVKVAVKGPSTVSSVFTLDSLKELGVKKGDKVAVLIKAVNVVLVKD